MLDTGYWMKAIRIGNDVFSMLIQYPVSRDAPIQYLLRLRPSR